MLHAYNNRETALAKNQPTDEDHFWEQEPDPEGHHDANIPVNKKTIPQLIPKLEISEISIDDQDFRKI